MVSFSYPNVCPIALPGASDLAALMQIARGTLFPGARPLSDADGREYFAQFCAAFQFVACLKRTDEFQGRAGDWVGRCEDWHQQRGTLATISLSPLMSAIVASGDVRWRAPRDKWPYDAYAGLSWSGRVAVPAWKTVLETRLCLLPDPVKQSPHREPVPTITQLDMVHGMGAKPFE
jgi:hypothetical protein